MYSKEIKKAVVDQIINMLINNILEENGTESFMGWLEDGDVFHEFINNDDAIKATCLAQEISPYVDKLSEILSVDFYD